MISVYYLINDTEWSPDLFNKLLKSLPSRDQDRMVKYLRWQDRQASVIGRLLLNQALIDLKSEVSLHDIAFNEYNKPYFVSGFPFFNITHSGKYVLCSVSQELPVGIDIEEHKHINLDDFKSVFTDSEWYNINNNPQIAHIIFYRYWSRKESVIKANGKGLNIHLNAIDVTRDRVSLEETTWFLKSIELDINYSCSLSSPSDNSEYKIHNVTIETLCTQNGVY